jgi:peptide-methionine (R)-S-oxide reductase
VSGDFKRKSDPEWRSELTPFQYHVLREKGTERAFTGEYWNHHDQGVYLCRACGNELFTSETKYDSGCGWPSFYQPIAQEHVETEADDSHGMQRTEVTCSRCGSHLGSLVRRRSRADRTPILHQLGLPEIREEVAFPHSW